MPIEGRTLHEAARIFCVQLNRTLVETVTNSRLVEFGKTGVPTTMVTFCQAGAPAEALLKTKYGPMRLYLGQLLGSVPAADRQHRLITLKYWYALTPLWPGDALLRWEYIRGPEPAATCCRHHLQGTVPIGIGLYAIPLNDWHLPTGYVAIEDILCFCIVDLGVAPLSEDWDTVLRDSYKRFREELTA